MSRYVCHFLVNLSAQDVQFAIRKLFAACDLDMIYETNDYLMAREIAGRVTFRQLVTADVSIDLTTATPEAVRLSFLVKNEELPLNPHNHCRQVFDLLLVTISNHYDWEPINTLRSINTPLSSQLEQNLHPRIEATTAEIPATQDPTLTTTANA